MAFAIEQGGYGSEERRANTKSLSHSPSKRNRANFETFANGATASRDIDLAMPNHLNSQTARESQLTTMPTPTQPNHI